jgi:hypothetical protein
MISNWLIVQYVAVARDLACWNVKVQYSATGEAACIVSLASPAGFLIRILSRVKWISLSFCSPRVIYIKELAMNRFLSFLAGVFSGALVGATVAILLAPTSGEEMRIQIQERAAYIQDEVKKAATERRVELEEQLSALRSPKQPSEPA